jgi:hypothetical protein
MSSTRSPPLSTISAIYTTLDQGLNKEALKLTTAAVKKFPNVLLVVALHALTLDRKGEAATAVDMLLTLINDPRLDKDCVYPIILVLRKSPRNFPVLAEFLERQSGTDYVSMAIALRLLTSYTGMESFPTSAVQMSALKGARANPELLKVVVLADAIQSDLKSKVLAVGSANKINKDFQVDKVVNSWSLPNSPEGTKEERRNFHEVSITTTLANNLGFAHLRALLADFLDDDHTRQHIAEKFLLTPNCNIAKLQSAWDLPVSIPAEINGPEWSVVNALERARLEDVSETINTLYKLADESKTAKVLLVALLSWAGAESEAEKKLKELKLQNAQWRTLTYLLKRPAENTQQEINKYMAGWTGDLVEATKQLVEAGHLEEIYLYKNALAIAQSSWSLVRVKLCALEEALLESPLRQEGLRSALSFVAGIRADEIYDDRDFAPFNPVSRGPKRTAEWFFTKRFVLDDLSPRLDLAKGLEAAISGSCSDKSPSINTLFRTVRALLHTSDLVDESLDTLLTESIEKLGTLYEHDIPYVFACLTLIGEKIPKKSALRASKDGAFRKLCAAVSLSKLQKLPDISFEVEAAQKSRDETEKIRESRLEKLKSLAKTLTR